MVVQLQTAYGGAGSLDRWARCLEIGVQEAARDDQVGRSLLVEEGGVP